MFVFECKHRLASADSDFATAPMTIGKVVLTFVVSSDGMRDDAVGASGSVCTWSLHSCTSLLSAPRLDLSAQDWGEGDAEYGERDGAWMSVTGVMVRKRTPSRLG